MLKFNIKEHKLEELKKYGFDFESGRESGIITAYKKIDSNKYREFSIIILIDEDTNLINEVRVRFDIFEMNVVKMASFKELDILYDLIKDGLIIKE